MSRTRAKFTQADVNRAARAAAKAGAISVRLLPDGTIKIDMQADPTGEKPENGIEYDRGIVL